MTAGVKYVVGVPKEIKTDEYRVAMIPVGVEELTRGGHKVLIQAGAGLGVHGRELDFECLERRKQLRDELLEAGDLRQAVADSARQRLSLAVAKPVKRS